MNLLLADHEAAIRAARDRSNHAIARQDLQAVALEWMDDVSVLGSTGAQASGIAANVALLAAQFARRPDTRYWRAPGTIRVLEAWAVAAELGQWSATWTEPDGPLRIGGSYQAQWRLVQGQWRIQGELFVPDYCEGGQYCRQHP